MDPFEAIKRKVRSARLSAPPSPWEPRGELSMPDLTEVGFADESELLLVYTFHGRAVVDCTTGEQIISEGPPDDPAAWYGGDLLTGTGLGPLQGRNIRLGGLHGGGLPVSTHDGWALDTLAIDWPDQSLLLIDPSSSIDHPQARFWKLAIEVEVRAAGFSYTGKTLVIATSAGLTIFSRA